MCMCVTLDTSHLEMSALNDDAWLNMPCMVVTLDTTHLEISPLNVFASRNMNCMVVTLDTSHLERSALNLCAPGTALSCLSKSNPLISVTAKTFQNPIGPIRSLEQSKSAPFRHSTRAALRSAFDLGAQAVLGFIYYIG